ncbi:mannan endo-1,6-alpha-mannosidase [Schizosaccharomyces japonicus yFS275]|uniref:Mannan endo-1,6-alpha-mannosidase n=1 Tax=Schizosaccharomyces japonicus (strain yFS275 / FY16936) TaxID=402676 RepID=B6K0J8_SCHJY|nr:mannan endo-1,6-alpha-mannosidase [Schizosaccharomyces japonicus yFS275]EEB07469.1 mannan endo-1,6-alpha-mannosidase [Schizosaccharomyces japonicus yFS275]
MLWFKTLLILLLSLLVQGIELNLNNSESIDSALSLVADGMLNYYAGKNYGGTIGMFVPPAYWWEAGAAFNGLLNRYLATGNDTYNMLTMQGMLHQIGDNSDYMPANYSTSEGNDDQAFWGLLAMSAAESNFTNPPPDEPQWLELAQAVFNQQVYRWDTGTCNGGLRWQITQFNHGYTYKNSVSNGAFFQLAARLGRYTGNQTFFEWADKVYNWSVAVGLVLDDYSVLDGKSTKDNCSAIELTQWTYNSGFYMAGSAFLYNATGSEVWKNRTSGFVDKAAEMFFYEYIVYEPACEVSATCNYDQTSFKGFLCRFMAYTAMLAPFTRETIEPYLKTTARAAATACSGGYDGVTCGNQWWWNNGTWDGLYGLGEQMSALEAIVAVPFMDAAPLYTHANGGSSTGDNMAGLYDDETSWAPPSYLPLNSILLLVLFWMPMLVI